MLRWLSKKEAAKYASISRKTLDVWVQNGLRCRKVGGRYFIRPEDIDDYIDKNDEFQSIDLDKLLNDL